MGSEAAAPQVIPGFTVRDRFFIGLASWLGWLAIRLLGVTWRYRTLGGEHYAELAKSGRPFIFSVWHDSILAPIYRHRNEGVMPMVSHHRDGEMIARTLSRLGYAPIRGSSTRGGSDALLGMVSALAAGRAAAAVMPDGPRGPRHVYKPGTVVIASRAGCPILPLSSDASHKIVFKSWDRMKLPLPFARVVVRYGQPIEIPPELGPEEFEVARARIESAMRELDRAATTDVEAL